MRIKNIRLRVKNLLDQLNIKEPPVDLETIAKHLNLTVEYEPLNGDVSGCLIRNKTGGTIGINSTHHVNRQRFTLAHEIGHFLLHQGELTFVDRGFERINFRDNDPSNVTNIEELEANKFAAELLMPEILLKEDVLRLSQDVEDGDLIDQLSKKYIVSRQALAIRLTNLDIG